MNKEGLPLFHTRHNGNTPDPKIAVENLRRIRERLKPEKMIVVGDRNAMDGEIALMLARDYNLDFIGAVKMKEKSREIIFAIDDKEFRPLKLERRAAEEYSAAETTVRFSHDGKSIDVRGMVVLSRRKAELDRQRRQEAVASMESELNEVRSRLNSRRYKRRDFVEKKVESILRKSNGKYYHLFRTDVKGDDARLSLDHAIDRGELEKESRLDGKYILATTLDWDAERVVEASRSRYLVESRMRNMKSDIAVRPVFLHDDRRMRALVFISILALMIYTLMEIVARRSGIRNVWTGGRRPITARWLLIVFSKISVIELSLKDGSRLSVVEDLAYSQSEVMKRLNFPMPESYAR